MTDLEAARKKTMNRVLKMRRANLSRNDSGGYDLIVLPDGRKTRVFTKKSFRLDREGNVMKYTRKTPRVKSNKTKKKRKTMQPKIEQFFVRESAS